MRAIVGGHSCECPAFRALPGPCTCLPAVQAWFDYYGWDYFWIGEMPENGSDEWIEYVP